MPARYILSVPDDDAVTQVLRQFPGAAGLVYREDIKALIVLDPVDGTKTEVPITNAVNGVAAGYVVARGEHQQATASDTIITGLATVVAVAITPRTVTLKQLFFAASVGDQAGTPAAGSIVITSKQPTAVDDVTPTAATDFTDNIKVNWIALGTLA